ncbi:MAG: hypothetical protein WKG03_06620, partial [Telluria sp.]
MCDTLRTSYEGWDITVRCLRFRAGSGERNGNSGSFTASGRAVLKNAAEERAWTDSRPQVVTLGGRIFDTTASCAQVLLAELTVLIDALKRVNGAPGK